jgi:hypothetical protein
MVLAVERPISTDEPPPPEPEPPRRRLWLPRRNWTNTVVALAYLGAAIAIMGSVWADPSGRRVAANPSDQTWFEWMLLHGVRVFTHGENPLFTHQLNAPLGVNLMVNTNVLALSLLFAPLTVWLGPSVTFVLLLTLGLAGTAYAWYYVIHRHFVGDRVAAIVGGAICGFGPGIIAHSNGHPNITAQFLVPLILWRALALRHTTHAWRDGATLAALIVVQTFINEEVLLDTALAGTVFVLVRVAMRPSVLRTGQPGRMLRGLGAAGLISVALLAYPIWFQFTGPGRVNGLPTLQYGFPYRLPLISYVTLPSQSWWGHPSANLWLAPAPEENSFLGWPMVIVAVAIAIVLWRRSPAVRALSVIGALFAYASLGNRVTISNPALSYPYSLWSHLDTWPVFNSVLATRLALVVLPIVALMFAHAIADARRAIAGHQRPLPPPRQIILADPDIGTLVCRRTRVRWLAKATRRRIVGPAAAVFGLVAIACALVTIIPRPTPTVAREPLPAFFVDGTWRGYVPAGYTVLTADPVDRVANMRWSLATNLAFSVPGGYFFGPDMTGRARYGPVLRPTMSLFEAVEHGHTHSHPGAPTVAQAIVDIRYWRTAIVVLAPGQPSDGDMLRTLDGLFGPGQYVDDVWIWDVLPLTNGPVATYSGVGGRAVNPRATGLR